MRKHLTESGLKSLLESITDKMTDCVKGMNQAQFDNNSSLEKEYRNKLFAYDMVIFSINLNSSVIEEKASNENG